MVKSHDKLSFDTLFVKIGRHTALYIHSESLHISEFLEKIQEKWERTCTNIIYHALPLFLWKIVKQNIIRVKYDMLAINSKQNQFPSQYTSKDKSTF